MSWGDGLDMYQNSRLVLDPCAQYCPCESPEHKMGQKPKTKKNQIELSSLHLPICLYELIILMWRMSKSDKYAHSKFSHQWRPGLFLAENWLFRPCLLDMDFNYLFCPLFTSILRGKPNQKSIGPKLTILASKNHKNGHFGQESLTKIPTPTFFNEFVCNFQNRCKYGFCK